MNALPWSCDISNDSETFYLRACNKKCLKETTITPTEIIQKNYSGSVLQIKREGNESELNLHAPLVSKSL